MKPCILQSEGDTASLARVLASELKGGVSVGLRGDLGAGKTTLVRLLVEALGGQGSHVTSPSYTLQNEYQLPDGWTVEHWDLYRIRELPLELREAPDENTVRLIEWPERASELINDLSLIIEIIATEAGEREVSFVGPLAEKIERAVSNECTGAGR